MTSQNPAGIMSEWRH